MYYAVRDFEINERKVLKSVKVEYINACVIHIYILKILFTNLVIVYLPLSLFPPT